MYRVFGSPYSLLTHQSALYLRYKNVKYALHVHSFVTTRLAVWWYGSSSTYGQMSPSGKTLPSFHDLVSDCEAQFPLPQIDVSAQNPQLKTLCLALQMYAQWWLMCTGGHFRWVHGEGSSMVTAHASYFLMSFAPVSKPLGNVLRVQAREMLRGYGICEESEEFIIRHFGNLCEALEKHFASNKYLLGTSFPTLADILMAAVFECHFLEDNPPQQQIRDNYPNIVTWVYGMQIGKYPESSPNATISDVVPSTLLSILHLVMEVLPWLKLQCDALRSWVTARRNAGELPVLQESIKKHAFRVPRLLDQAWTMSIPDGPALQCKVSMHHLFPVQFAAEEVRSLSLPAGALSEAVQLHTVLREMDISPECRTVQLPLKGADLFYGVIPTTT